MVPRQDPAKASQIAQPCPFFSLPPPQGLLASLKRQWVNRARAWSLLGASLLKDERKNVTSRFLLPRHSLARTPFPIASLHSGGKRASSSPSQQKKSPPPAFCTSERVAFLDFRVKLGG